MGRQYVAEEIAPCVWIIDFVFLNMLSYEQIAVGFILFININICVNDLVMLCLYRIHLFLNCMFDLIPYYFMHILCSENNNLPFLEFIKIIFYLYLYWEIFEQTDIVISRCIQAYYVSVHRFLYCLLLEFFVIFT